MAYNEYKVDPYVRAWNRIADHGEICSGGFDPKNDPDDRDKVILGTCIGVILLVIAAMFSGCNRKVYIPVERTTAVTEILKDTVVEIQLKQVRDTVTTETFGRDTTSYLENGHSYSYASIAGGVLGHSLGTLPEAKLLDTLKVKTVIIRDSIPYPVQVEVEKKLTFWQKVKIEYGGFAMGVAAAFAFLFVLMLRKDIRRD